MRGSTHNISVIIPTKNEAGSIEPLVARLSSVLNGNTAEVIFADDSTDDTPQIIRKIAENASIPIVCLHRAPAERAGGLSGAVVAGLRVSTGDIAIVMDGDLQHPPESLPEMVRILDDQDVDVVVGSRYSNGGHANGLSKESRHRISRAVTGIAKALFPHRLNQVSDPMSGFFAVRLAALDVEKLRPMGFKIFLEVVLRNTKLRVREMGFAFAPRHSGKSKASLREGMRFFAHISRLRLSTAATPRLRRAVLFGIVGASGVAVNTAAFWMLARAVPYLIAAVLATPFSTSWNFIGTEGLVYRGRKPGTRTRRYLAAYAVNTPATVVGQLPFLFLLVSVAHTPKVLANLLSLFVVFLIRFAVNDRFIYHRGAAMTLGATTNRLGPVDVTTLTATPARLVPGAASRVDCESFRHCYNIHRIVTIGSDVRLAELEHFRCAPYDIDRLAPDIAVRVGRVGKARVRARLTRLVDPRLVTWEEHFGRLSANFSVEFGPQIKVVSSRALASSPHVLYTNVLEALLRFVFVDRGYMLLHAACMEVDGRGVMLSARTDTGKTGTVLKLLRERDGMFLSDDMTIVDSEGAALCYPKPLTISSHTLRAVDAGDLSPSEWRKLRWQSRIHSKEGRGFAMTLAAHNLPIMTINGWVQRLVPPPKYEIQRLVRCQLTSTTRINELFIIERGEAHHSFVQTAQAIGELLENTEDAYGFPPYRYLAPSIVLGELDYEALKEKERLILISAMESVRVHRLGSNDFSWYELISQFLDSNAIYFAARNGNGKRNGHGSIARLGDLAGDPIPTMDTTDAMELTDSEDPRA
jgi:glycosyltransferase involved in cell wall biosynthesis